MWPTLFVLFVQTSSTTQSPLWLQVARVDRPERTQAILQAIRPHWTQGGRLQNFVPKRIQEPSGNEAVVVLLGPYESLSEALRASLEIQRSQPWASQGLFVQQTPLWHLDGQAPIPLASLRTTMRTRGSRASNRRPQKAGAQGRPASKSQTVRPLAPSGIRPRPAESLVARGFGFAAPAPALPAARTSIVSFGPWDPILIFEEREVCAQTPAIRGGPPMRLKPGPRSTTLQEHPAGRRCLDWSLCLVGDRLALAWVPTMYVAPKGAYKTLELQTRWGPATVRIQLHRVGSSPRGDIYQLVLRQGAFPPVLDTFVPPPSCPPPYKPIFDASGMALFDARGLVCLRRPVRLPAPPVPPLWRRTGR